MRRDPTPAEKILWTQLRGRRFAGFKFRRQEPIGKFIADFFCFDAMLIVELDGQTHLGCEAEDARRQLWFESLGYRVLRFWNSQLYEHGEAVLRTIWLECNARKGKGARQKSPLSPGEAEPA
jgi:very-short-patch-repair endonuclease